MREDHILRTRNPLRLLLPERKPPPSDLRRPSAILRPPASRKEVIQPQVPLRLPCYDFTPVADLTVVG
jgi:hypothetical protein